MSRYEKKNSLNLNFLAKWRSNSILKSGVEMEIVEELSGATTTQARLARYLGLSKARINQLIDEKIVLRDETDPKGKVLAFDSVRNYYLSQKADGDGSINFWTEKAKREQVNRKRDELKLRKEEGSVYDAKTVELAFLEMLTILRTQLLGFPTKFAVQLEGKSRDEIYDILTQEIESKLAEMSEYDLKSWSAEIKKDAAESDAEKAGE